MDHASSLSLDILLLVLSPHAHLFTFKINYTFFFKSLNLCTFSSFCLETPTPLLPLLTITSYSTFRTIGKPRRPCQSLTICPLLSADCPQTHQQFPTSHSLKACSGYRMMLYPPARELTLRSDS